MRIIKDGVGDVRQDGNVIHTNVRFLQDDKRRVAVFNGKSAPVAVYEAGVVEFNVSRRPCACKGDLPKLTLQRLWDQSEKAAARAS